WWSYYELGWGGWWFWDPVENASFMPWLVGTALMHSLAVTEKRAAFKSWTVLLAISAFSLSLLGTFLVRSGVLTSVHAFATDPTRGAYILLFLCVVIGGSLALYAWRAPSIAGGGRFDLLSRETSLLVNNLLLTTLTVVVLFGTLAPLIYEAAGWGKISVGFPWFNKMFVALSPALILATGMGPLLRWKHDEALHLLRRLWWVMLLSLGVLALPFYSDTLMAVAVGLALTAWLVLTHLASLFERLRHKGGLLALRRDFSPASRGYYGMWLAHLGLAVFVVGVTLVSNHGSETDVRMSPGERYETEGYHFQFHGVTSVSGPNYLAQRGHFTLYEDERAIAELYPEKRKYLSSSMPMTEAAIDAGLLRDVYVSLGEPIGTEGDWSMRLYYKPYVRWIWLGTILMSLGGLLAVTDRRYRVSTRAAARAPA
ncbi:MAG: cytochrome c biogenesis protein CcsA, partial [Chromatiaceae bacterium]|nr:cytochrome c biogenesis protein CcsA [Chromatiaceae bacterium]